MPDTRPATSRMAFVGVLLVVAGLGLWALYRLTVSSEPHSFAAGGIAPTDVRVTAGTTYDIAIPGGVHAEADLGLDPGALRCTLITAGSGAQALTITPDQTDTKATNQVATFVSPVTGSIHIDCPGLPAVFVDNADDASGDRSGLWLVLASIALAIGVPLTLSVLRRHPVGGPAGPAVDDDQDVDAVFPAPPRAPAA